MPRSHLEPTTIIVVPCYNEAERLDQVARTAFTDYAKANPGVRFLLVNDGSSDHTSERLHRLVAEHPDSFSIEELPTNVGKGEAVRLGLNRAISDRAISELPVYVGYWDADLATPLTEINTFQNVLEDDRDRVDAVLGCRIPLAGRSVERHRSRAVLSRLFACATRVVLGVRLHDTQCGAKLFRVTDELAAVLEQPFTSKWIFDVELIARMMKIRQANSSVVESSATNSSSRIFEQPLRRWTEQPGSKLRPRHFLTAAISLGAIFWRYRVLGGQGTIGLPAKNQSEPVPAKLKIVGRPGSSSGRKAA